MSKNLQISIDDTAVQAYLDKLKSEFGKAKTVVILREIAETILERSSAMAPFDKGGLIGSGAIKPLPSNDGWRIFYNIEYASYQHEGVRADGTHKIQAWQNGRQGKYLEKTLKNNLPAFLKSVASETNKKLK